MRIVLFADGDWAVNSLARLLESGHSVQAVVLRLSPSGTALEEAVRERGIPIFQPAKVNDLSFVSRLRQLRPDLGISIAYNQIFKASAYDFLPLGLINFHAGKLPFYRGRNVVNWAILNGETEIGLSSHFIDEGIDTGRIIRQTTLPIAWTDGYGDVLNRIVQAFPDFVMETLRAIESGEIEPLTQSLEGGTYFPGRDSRDEWLDWNDTSFNLHNKIRAITRPGPGARTLLGDDEVRIWRAYYDPTWPKYLATPGAVVGRDAAGVRVKTGDSLLLIQEIQLPGAEPQRPAWALGTRLGVDPQWIVSTLKQKLRDLDPLLFATDRKR
jgi:methionyl-tRNA formyltransferase